MMVRFTELVSKRCSSPAGDAVNSYDLSEVWINENYVVNLKEAAAYRSLLAEGKLPPDLDSSHVFTTITTTHGGITDTHVVVGDVKTIATQLNGPPGNLLKG